MKNGFYCLACADFDHRSLVGAFYIRITLQHLSSCNQSRWSVGSWWWDGDVSSEWASEWSGVDLVDHGLSQRLQHLPLVVVKVSIDLVDGAVLHHPQMTLSLCDEPGVVTHNDHSCNNKEQCVSISCISIETSLHSLMSLIYEYAVEKVSLKMWWSKSLPVKVQQITHSLISYHPYLLCIHWWPLIKHRLTQCLDCWWVHPVRHKDS